MKGISYKFANFNIVLRLQWSIIKDLSYVTWDLLWTFITAVFPYKCWKPFVLF